MELQGKNRIAHAFKISGDQVVCDWEAMHARHGSLCGKASPVYIAREMKDGDVIAAVKSGRFPSTTVVVRGKRGGKPLYVMFPEAESTAAFLGFLEENGLGARVEAVRKKIDADRIAAEEREKENQRWHNEMDAKIRAKMEEIRKTAVKGFYQSVNYNDYGPNPVDVHLGIGWFVVDEGHYYFAPLLEDTPLSEGNPELRKVVETSPLGTNAMGGLTVWECTAEQEAAAIEAEAICHAERERVKKEEAERATQEKARKDVERAEKARRELEAAMETELMYFDETPLANATNRLLHSIAACEQNGIIAIYETRDCHNLRAPGLRDLSPQLKALGANWNEQEREWELSRSDENREKVVAFLRKHDVKKDPVELGYSRCWECGVWHKGGTCPCCGE